MFKGFKNSVVGYNHVKIKKPLQDASNFKIAENYAIVTVADGHGGEKYFRSDIGAKIAVESTIDKLSEFCNNEEYYKLLSEKDDMNGNCKKIEQIIKSIIYSWQQKVELHFNNTELSDSEIDLIKKHYTKDYDLSFYGTTLLFSCITADFNIYAQIGDGKCAILNDKNEVIYPINDDERLSFGVTTSMCDSNAINDFRYELSYNNINAVILATDGVVDSYSLNSYPQFLKSIIKNYQNNDIETDKELNNWLPILSEKGSHDDVTIAGIYKI